MKTYPSYGASPARRDAMDPRSTGALQPSQTSKPLNDRRSTR
jgi:hypothetical protein